MKRKIFFPGSFSPFHDGHYSMIKQLLQFDNSEIEIIISNKNRDNIKSNIVFDFVKDMFKSYNNIIVTLSDISPILYVYNNTNNDDIIYSLIRSNKDNDSVVDSYTKVFNNAEKLNIDYIPISFTTSHNKQLISATLLREDIQNKNWKAFKTGYKILLNDKIISEYKLKKFYKKLMEV